MKQTNDFGAIRTETTDFSRPTTAKFPLPDLEDADPISIRLQNLGNLDG